MVTRKEDEAEILQRVRERFLKSQGEKLGMPAVFAAVLIGWSRDDILDARKEPRRYTRPEAERECLKYFEENPDSRRRRQRAGSPLNATIIQWSNADQRAADTHLRNRAFFDPETGAIVRFELWDTLPPPPADVEEKFCVVPRFEWPPAARPLDQFELGAFIFGFMLAPTLTGITYLEEGATARALGEPTMALPARIRDRAAVAARERPYLPQEQLRELAVDVRAHLAAFHPVEWQSKDDRLIRWFDIGEAVSSLALAVSMTDSDIDGRVQMLTDQLRSVSMSTVDRLAFAEFIRAVRSREGTLDAYQEAENLVVHFAKEWTAWTISAARIEYEMAERAAERAKRTEMITASRNRFRYAAVKQLLACIVIAVLFVTVLRTPSISLVGRAVIGVIVFFIGSAVSIMFMLDAHAFVYVVMAPRTHQERRIALACAWLIMALTNPLSVGMIVALLATK